jgi:hypothetical protein
MSMATLEMDLGRINLIRGSSIELLRDENYVVQLIPLIGLNNEIPDESPEITKRNVGGLYLWQYPNQFGRYLCFLSRFKIKSYIEIGVRTGGTFLTTVEYLAKINSGVSRAVAIDINPIPIGNLVEFYQVNSLTQEFDDALGDSKFDLAFIDGEHSYAAVESDFNKMRSRSTIIAIHDIYNDLCGDVMTFWNNLKATEYKEFDFYEFIEQYEDVVAITGQRHMGIGVAVKRVLH